MGYDVKMLKGIDVDIKRSPVIRAKKQKTCDRNGESDWNYLLESKHHDLFHNQMNNILGFGVLQSAKDTSDAEFTSGSLQGHSGKK